MRERNSSRVTRARRPYGLRLTLVLLAVLALLQLGLAALFAMPGIDSRRQGSDYAAIAFLTLTALWTFATAVAVARRQRNGWISLLLLATLLAGLGAYGLTWDVLAYLQSSWRPKPIDLLVSALHLCLVTLGIWWLVSVTRPSTRALFRNTSQ